MAHFTSSTDYVVDRPARYDVFLSYSRADTEIMKQVRAALENVGLSVWVDETALQPGEPSWLSAIESAIDDSACLLAILSPAARNSRWVRKEMHYAQTQGKQLFHLLACGDVRTAVPFEYIDAQWVDIRDPAEYAEGMARLIESIRAHLDSIVVVPPGEYDAEPDVEPDLAFTPEAPAPRAKPAKSTKSKAAARLWRWLARARILLRANAEAAALYLRELGVSAFIPRPWDWLRVLWWLVFVPDGWAIAQERLEFGRVRSASAWIASSLFYLALVASWLGFYYDRIPGYDRTPFGYSFGEWGLFLGSIWVVTALVGTVNAGLASLLLVSVAGLTLGFVANVPLGPDVGIPALVAMSVASAVALGLMWHTLQHPGPWWLVPLIVVPFIVSVEAVQYDWTLQDMSEEVGISTGPAVAFIGLLPSVPALLGGILVFFAMRAAPRSRVSIPLRAALLLSAVIAVFFLYWLTMRDGWKELDPDWLWSLQQSIDSWKRYL